MSQHRRLRWTPSDVAKWRPIIAATLPAPCVQPRCQLGGIVHPDQAWDVGHIVGIPDGGTNDADNLGSSHRRCNRSDGGKTGVPFSA